MVLIGFAWRCWVSRQVLGILLEWTALFQGNWMLIYRLFKALCSRRVKSVNVWWLYSHKTQIFLLKMRKINGIILVNSKSRVFRSRSCILTLFWLIALMCVYICVRSVRRVQREQSWMRPKTSTSLCQHWGTWSRPWLRERYSGAMLHPSSRVSYSVARLYL